jgi:uroporphyrinogen-III synthase
VIHVVLTRAESDAKRQLDLLANRGFMATALPLLAIEPVAVAPAVETELENSSIFIFTSVNAVTHGLSHVVSACRNASTRSASTLSASTRVLAVGRKTRELLSDHGIDASSPDREDSEGLLELLNAMDNGSPRSLNPIALIKGEGGRDLISSVLSQQGLSIVEVNCYRRIWPSVSRSTVSDALDSAEPRYIHVASGETLSRLEELCAVCGVNAHEKHTVILPSDRVENQARELGWQSRIVAAGASDDALLEVLSTLS